MLCAPHSNALACRSFYWMSLVLPSSWRIVPEHTQQQLALLSAGVPVLAPIASARLSFSRPERWLLWQLGWRPHHFLPYDYALCSAAVNETTLQPSGVVTCSLHDRRVDDATMGSVRTFTILPDSSQHTPATPTDTFSSSAAPAPAAAQHPPPPKPPLSCPHLGSGLIFGPLGRRIVAAAQRWRPTALLVAFVLRLWRCLLPTGGLVRPLCPVLSRIHLFAYDHPLNALIMQALGTFVLCVTVCVCQRLLWMHLTNELLHVLN